MLLELVKSLKMKHFHVEEDCYYCCAACPDCYDDYRVEQRHGRCDCGADGHNLCVDEVLAISRELLAACEAAAKHFTAGYATARERANREDEVFEVLVAAIAKAKGES